jgi:hypothetical protein
MRTCVPNSVVQEKPSRVVVFDETRHAKFDRQFRSEANAANQAAMGSRTGR